jgi:hypothetical protein
MALCLNRLTYPVEGCVLRKGPRVFGLLGKVTAFGVDSFGRDDVGRHWALTAEYGSLRLEHLAGDEELTGDRLLLPTSLSYNYGITGGRGPAEMARAVFGLLPEELELLVTVLRRGSFPVLGFSYTDLKCSLSSCVIPGCWPHVVTSSLALYGNVVSLETFIRVVVSSLPQGRLGVRFPSLQPVFKHLMRLLIARRRGVPYSKEMLELAPAPAAGLAAK